MKSILKKYYIVEVIGGFHHSRFGGYVIASGRSLDKGFITPLTLMTLDEAKDMLFKRCDGIKNIAMKKYLFKTYNSALKFTQQDNITHVVDKCFIHEVERYEVRGNNCD